MSAPIHWLLGCVLAAGIVSLATRAKALSPSGAVAAWAIGTVIFGAGGWGGAAALLTFFGTSTALTRWRKTRKDALDYEKGGRRDAGQVLANGGVAAACLLIPFLFPRIEAARPYFWFLAALASANADTWATEIGSALGGRTWDLRSGKPAPPGTSGAVSLGGTLAALAGAALLGLLFAPDWSARLLVTAAGWGGAFADSLLGAYLQAQWREAGTDRWSEQPRPCPPERGLRFCSNDVVNLFAAAIAVCLAASLEK